MSKNPSFWVLSVLLLLSASFGVSSAHAADDDYQFCVYGQKNDNVLYLGQYKTSETKPAGFDANGRTYVCYDYWYQMGTPHNDEANWNFDDAWSHIAAWSKERSKTTSSGYAHIYVVTDLVFAGHTIDGNGDTICKDGKNAFKGKFFDLIAKYMATIEARTFAGGLLSSSEQFRKISGLCGISSDTAAGFIGRLEYTYASGTSNVEASIKKLWFDNAYFKSSNNWSSNGVGVGIVASAALGGVSTNNIDNYDNPRDHLTIKVTNSEFHGFSAGAVFGKGGKSFPDVQLENVNVYGMKYAGAVVGSVDEAGAGNALSISHAEIKNTNVNVSDADGYAGGLVGYISNSNAQEMALTIQRNFTVGSITGASGSKLGYLIGGLNDESKFTYNVINNIHFGSGDPAANKTFGTSAENDWRNPALNSVSGNIIRRNFRNAVTGLEADGNLRYVKEDGYPIQTTDNAYYNGVVSSEQMKSRRMAAILNIPNGGWTIENDDLPVHATYSDEEIRPTYFIVDELLSMGDAAHKQKLQNAIDDGSHPLEYCDGYRNNCFLLYPNASGELDASDIAFAKSLVEEPSNGASWDGNGNPLVPNYVLRGASFAYRTPSTKYFCFTPDGNNLKFSQETAETDPSSGNKDCYNYWSDARNYVHSWLGTSTGKSVVLTMDIEFAGNSNGSCNGGVIAFDGEPLELREGQTLDGANHTISGLCYVGSDSTAFVKLTDKDADVKNITFSNVYFKVNNSSNVRGQTGLIAFDIPDIYDPNAYAYVHGEKENISDITVENSYFESNRHIGAVLALWHGDIKKIENVKVNDVTVKGRVAGSMIGSVHSLNEISFENVRVESGTVVGDTLGGFVGLAKEVERLSIEKSHSDAKLSGKGATSQIGGFIGYIEKSDLSIQYNGLTGSITCSSGANSHCGYLVGAEGQDVDNIIYGNYFFETASANTSNATIARIGIGSFTDSQWKTTNYISNNIRNTTGVAGITDDGHLGDGSSPILNTQYKNGMVPDAEMKTPRLAYVLNEGNSPGEWTFKVGENNNLPKFRADTDGDIFKVTFYYEDFFSKASAAQQQILRNSLDNGPYPKEGADNAFVLYTDNTGKLTPDEVDFIKSITETDNYTVYWDGSTEWTNNNIRLNNSPVFTGDDSYAYHSPALYFCFEEDGDNLYFTQERTDYDPTSGDMHCFVDWYNGGSDDARTYLIGSAPDDYGIEKTVILKSDIVFAGTKTDNNGKTVCENNAPNAFKGGYLKLGQDGVIKNEDGDKFKISGLCYVNESGNNSIAFVRYTSNNQTFVKNLNFSDVYFKLNQSDNTDVGVVSMGDLPISSLEGISVENSYFEAKYAGAVVGNMENESNWIDNLKNITVSNVTVKGMHAGGVMGHAGRVFYIQDIMVNNVTVDGSNVAGAVIGREFTDHGQPDGGYVDVSNVTVDGTTKVTGDTVGGLFGKLHIEAYGEGDSRFRRNSIRGTFAGGHISGGLVGFFDDFDAPIHMNYNYVNGKISVTETGGESGYLIGGLDIINQGSNALYDITGNYYIADNGSTAITGIGSHASIWKNPC